MIIEHSVDEELLYDQKKELFSTNSHAFSLIFTHKFFNEYKSVFFCHISEAFSIAIAYTDNKIDIFNRYSDEFSLIESFDYYYQIEQVQPIFTGEIAEILITFRSKMLQIVTYNIGQHFFKNHLMYNGNAIVKNPFRLGNCKTTSSQVYFNECLLKSEIYLLLR